MILLDTDICIELLRGNNKIIEKRKTPVGSTLHNSHHNI